MLTAGGEQVTLRPMPGTPLQVATDIRFLQTGSDAPSHRNVRPITGCAAATLTHSGAEHTMEFDAPVYMGTLDWSTGILTVTHKQVCFTGEEAGWRQQDDESVINYNFFNDAVEDGTNYLQGWCSHVPTGSKGRIEDMALRKGWKSGYVYISDPVGQWGLPDAQVATWIAYLKEQAATGTPVQVVYPLKNPQTVQLTPAQFTAQPGENTLSCDTGDTSVTYRADPRVLLETLCIE